MRKKSTAKRRLFAALFRTRRRQTTLAFLAVIVALAVAILPSHFRSPYPSAEDVLDRLRTLREAKAAALHQYFTVREEIARRLAADSRVLSCLQKFKGAWDQGGAKGMEYKATEAEFAKVVSNLTQSYSYYDVFLIDDTGKVVYTLKRESDFGVDVTGELFRETLIGKCYKRARDGMALTDVAYYAPSKAPALFLGMPLVGPGGEFKGCVAFQFALEDLNRIMVTGQQELGQTGEHYLVRSDKIMLTESRFIPDTELKQVVDTDATREALEGHAGESVIKDYRGVDVLSAYASFEVGTIRWAIIVEIDVDEAVLSFSDSEQEQLLEAVAAVVDAGIARDRVSLDLLDPARDAADIARFHDNAGREFLEVETGEMKEAASGELLFTKGVATCTAVTVSGEGFGYLLHVSPTDRSYGLDEKTQQALGSLCTNLISQVMDRIRARPGFRERDVGKLTVGIFAVDASAVPSMVKALQCQGIGLRQIRLVLNRGPRALNLVFDYANGAAYSQWRFAENPVSAPDEKFHNVYGVVKSVGQIAAEILRREITVS